MYIYIYIHVYIYIYTHTHTYIHTYIYVITIIMVPPAAGCYYYRHCTLITTNSAYGCRLSLCIITTIIIIIMH